MIPDSGEIIKFDEEGNTGRLDRFLSTVRHFLDSRLFLAVLVIFVAVGSFELGLIANLNKQRPAVTISEPVPAQDARLLKTEPGSQASGPSEPKQGTGGTLVASKGGTKYYYPWCGGANRISTANKIYFASVAEARAKGYTPAANCKGLQ
ncbi:MAG: hypothetical protein WC764_03930 [Candidatus Paceibacterota bacterium]|jgi:hypothetical protein